MHSKNELPLPGSDNRLALFFMCVSICLQVVACSGEPDTGNNGSATASYVESVTRCGQQGASPCDHRDPETTEQPNFVSLEDKTTVASPAWRHAIDGVQLVMSVTEGIANILTFVTLQVNGGSFSPLTAFLLKQQSLCDASVCVFATAAFLQTSVSHAGVLVIDAVTCFLWYNQYLYWVSVFMSVWNLVLIAFDRLLAVCYPIRYTMPSPLHLKIVLPVLYFYACATNYPGWFLVHFVDGHCLQEISLPIDIHIKVFYWHSIYWVFIIYLIPIALLSVIYGRIVLKLRAHLIAVAPASLPECISKSTIRVTKCAITVTVVFILTISYQSIYFCMSSVGIVSWDFGGPVQLFGMMLVVLNSLGNPFIYYMYMPSFRRCLMVTFCRKGSAGQEETTT